MKKFSHLLMIIIGATAAVLLTLTFVSFYAALGHLDSSGNVTLFKLLASIDYRYMLVIFALVALYMGLMDGLILLIISRFRRLAAPPRISHQSRLRQIWFRYRTLHLTFILLTLFVTLSISAPSTVMNSFTAIVSISVLVSNLTKKIGK